MTNDFVQQQAAIYEDSIHQLMTNVYQHFYSDEPMAVQRIREAISYVRSPVLKHLTENEPGIVQLAFRDSQFRTIYTQFPFKLATQPSCSTCQREWCVHQLAGLFYLYAQHHSLNEWFEKWQLEQKQQKTVLTGERTPEQWELLMNQALEPLHHLSITENPARFVQIYQAIEQSIKRQAPFEWEWKPLFLLQFHLQNLIQNWAYVSAHLNEENQQFSYSKWHMNTWLAEQIQQIKQAISTIKQQTPLFEMDPFYDHLQRLLRAFILQDAPLFDKRLPIYFAFWERFFNRPAILQKEHRALTENTEEQQLLQAYLASLHHDTEQFMATLDLAPCSQLPAWICLAKWLEEQEQIEELHALALKMYPQVPAYFTEAVSPTKQLAFIRLMDGLFESAQLDEQQREQLFMLYGTVGVTVYADFLIERARYTEWAALMHRFAISFEIVDAAGLQVALEENSRAAFPLVHHFVVQRIEERNRQSYRRAIALLKRMRTAAKRQQDESFWNAYLNELQATYKRLRAFIEEFDKGGLYL